MSISYYFIQIMLYSIYNSFYTKNNIWSYYFIQMMLYRMTKGHHLDATLQHKAIRKEPNILQIKHLKIMRLSKKDYKKSMDDVSGWTSMDGEFWKFFTILQIKEVNRFIFVKWWMPVNVCLVTQMILHLRLNILFNEHWFVFIVHL